MGHRARVGHEPDRHSTPHATESRRGMGQMDHRDEPAQRRQAEAYAIYEALREFLYRLPEGHPSRPSLHTAAVAAFCHWRESMAPPPAAETPSPEMSAPRLAAPSVQ